MEQIAAMIWELVYTSIEHGLLHDSSGFGVAAATSGIPAAVSDILAAGSGYDAVFSHHSSEYNLNPVADFHYTVRLGNAGYHWVGRVSAAGVDYSGRSNMLAHHLFIHENAVGKALPENLLAECNNAGLIELGKTPDKAKWLKPIPKLPDSIVTPPVRAGLWEKYFGDSGWAGILARQVINKGVPVYIVFRKGWDVKGLLNEAISLLPPQMHWQVTYNTYFTAIAGTLNCDWRFCYSDSPVLEGIKQKNMSIIIDGSQPPPADPWCDFARGTGPSPLGMQSWNVNQNVQQNTVAAAAPENPGRENAKMVFTSHAVRKVVVNGNKKTAAGNGFWEKSKEYILPVLLLMIAAAGIIWMLFSGDREAAPESVAVVAKETPAPRRTSRTADIFKRRAEQAVKEESAESGQKIAEVPVVRETAVPEREQAISGRGKKNITDAQETVPLKTTLSNPLTVHPDELDKIARNITEKALFGEAGTADTLLELPSPVRPDIITAEGFRIIDTPEGFSISVGDNEFCRFIAPADGGNWKVQFMCNFLPGTQVFTGMEWSSGESGKPVAMRFRDCVQIMDGFPGYWETEDNRLYYTIAFLPENSMQWERLQANAMLDGCIWNKEMCLLVFPDEEYNSNINMWFAQKNKEIQNHCAVYDQKISYMENELNKWKQAAAEFWQNVEQQCIDLEKKEPGKPPRMKDEKDYRRAYNMYTKALDKWRDDLEDIRKDGEKTYNRVYLKEIEAYSAHIEKLRLERENIQFSEELQQAWDRLMQERASRCQEWSERSSISVPLAGGSRYIEIKFPPPEQFDGE